MPVISIEIDNVAESYSSGDTIKGRVILQVDEPMEAKEVAVVLEGNGRVSWTETIQDTVDEPKLLTGDMHQTCPRSTLSSPVTYSARETYVNHSISLAGDGYNLFELPEGRISYPFQFVLPTNIPSSFSSSIGSISYSIEAELKRTSLELNKQYSIPINVKGVLDLNNEPTAGDPQEVQEAKGSNILLLRTGRLEYILKIPRSGFVPGEVLDFSSHVVNDSNKRVTGMTAALKQHITYHAKGKSKTEMTIIKELNGPQMEIGHGEVFWMPHDIIIPPKMHPTGLGGASFVIDVKYVLKFEIQRCGLSRSMIAKLPIMIGTIPLGNTYNDDDEEDKE